MIERGRYGSVEITVGPLRGHVGFYDDDGGIEFEPCGHCDGSFESDCIECEKIAARHARAIVYLGKPLRSEFVLIKYEDADHLPENTKNIEVERLKREHPELCDKMGIENV